MKIKFFSVIISLLIIAGCHQTRRAEPAARQNTLGSATPFLLDSLMNYSSEADLVAHFGEANVTRDTAWYPEGEGQYIVTRLFRDTDKEVEFTWNDTINFSSLLAITLNRQGSVWKTSEGITVGTTLLRLVELNKKEIEFSGLEWDYGGLVFWNEGALQHRGLQVTLGLPENYDTAAAIDSIIGDQRVLSSSSIARKINPVVVEVVLMKEHE